MPYYDYRGGDYYRGDYYRAGGIFDVVGKALGGIGRAVGGAIGGFIRGGPVGAVLGAGRAVLPQIAGKVVGQAIALPGGGPRVNLAAPQLPALPPIGGIASQVATGGLVQVQMLDQRTGQPAVKVVDTRTGRVVGSRRRMNVANPRALRKALRRIAGFGKLARRAKRDVARAASAIGVRSNRNGGSRGVITRSEAARALRK